VGAIVCGQFLEISAHDNLPWHFLFKFISELHGCFIHTGAMNVVRLIHTGAMNVVEFILEL
jgi:hypothetical protein